MSDIPRKKVRPTERKTPLLNPHKGCETFQRFNGDPLYEGQKYSEEGPLVFAPRQFEGTTPGYLPTTVAYCRWFWEQFEPQEGKYDWSMIERSLETAHQRSQTLHVRLMPHGAPKQPSLPKWYIDKYPTIELSRYGGTYIGAFYDSMEYLYRWGGAISEFGRRFDGHPDLEAVDMSYIGMWGEGHGECSKEGAERMTAVYTSAHTVTPVLAMIGKYPMIAGVRAGCGWRCDSSDDLGLWGNPVDGPLRWNHLYDYYPYDVVASGGNESWKTAPVAYEPGGLLMKSFELGFDLEFIIQQNLKYHGSLISMKSAALPEAWMPRLERFCNDLGYRFVLRQFAFDAEVRAGETFNQRTWIENVGVAPIYRRYALAVRFTQGDRTVVRQFPDDIRAWLPGDACLVEPIRMPREFLPGPVMLHMGLVDLKTNEPKVRFAVEGATSDGWVPLDTVEVLP